MNSYGLTGFTSTIIDRVIELIPDPEYSPLHCVRDIAEMPTNLDRYVLCAGVMYGQKVSEMETMCVLETFAVNYIDVVVFLERLFENNTSARVCVIGSMSGINGSYDTVYAGSKAALHLYVKTKQLTKRQHLVCVAPTIIEDAGMTTRRKDYAATMSRGKNRRLGRWLKSDEVAKTVMFAIENDAMCNTVIELNGGNW